MKSILDVPYEQRRKIFGRFGYQINENKLIIPEVRRTGDEMDENFSRKLDEGYFKSYPTDVVKNDIRKFIDSNHERIGSYVLGDEYELYGKKDEENDFQILILAVKNLDDHLRKDLEALLLRDGWYIGDEQDNSDKDSGYGFIIEPRFPIENSEVLKRSLKLINDVKIFFHVSFRKYQRKILKNGLLPSIADRQFFKHPERVYLFSNERIAYDFLMRGYTDNLKYTKELHVRKTNHGKIDANDKYQDKPNDVKDYLVAFKVDLKRMADDGKIVSLYHDNRFSNDSGAYFTQNSIPVKYVEEIKF